MIRPYILRTLLYKEYLRYRYNWGLLAVVGALLALSALVSVSSRLSTVQSFGTTEMKTCRVLYRPGTTDENWIKHLEKQTPPADCVVHYEQHGNSSEKPKLTGDSMAIELLAPTAGSENRTVRFWYVGPPSAASIPVRDWFVRHSNDFLATKPRLLEETSQDAEAVRGSSTAEKLPLIVTALAIFALYLLSFNLYITSTGEEREKRVLLGLLMTPVSALEVIVAKAIFYASASLVVALAIVGMYQPRLLLNPFLWGGIICGSISYVAIGTVAITVVRRQTTINTVSMLYLIATSLIMILSQLLPLFTLVKLFLVENYLHGLMKLIISGEGATRSVMGYMAALAIGTFCWSAVAVWVFAKKGTSISRGR